MNEQELRLLVREAIARHMGTEASADPRTFAPSHRAPSHRSLSRHASFGMFALPTGSDAEGPCVIEPSVTCNHCGYCKSYGH
jgi:hypothetical protein